MATMAELFKSQEKDIQNNINESRNVNKHTIDENLSNNIVNDYQNPYTCVPLHAPNFDSNLYYNQESCMTNLSGIGDVFDPNYCVKSCEHTPGPPYSCGCNCVSLNTYESLGGCVADTSKVTKLGEAVKQPYSDINPITGDNITPEIGFSEDATQVPKTGIDFTPGKTLTCLEYERDKDGNWVVATQIPANEEIYIESSALKKDDKGNYILPAGITEAQIIHNTLQSEVEKAKEQQTYTKYIPNLGDNLSVENYTNRCTGEVNLPEGTTKYDFHNNLDNITNLDKCNLYNIPGIDERYTDLKLEDNIKESKDVDLPKSPNSGFQALGDDGARSLTNIANNTFGKIVSAYQGIGNSALNVTNSLMNTAIGGVMGSTMDAAADIASIPGQMIQKGMDQLASSISDTGQNVKNVICGFKNKIVKEINNDELVKKGKEIFNNITDAISNWDDKLLNSDFFTGNCLCRLPRDKSPRRYPIIDRCSNSIYTDEYNKIAYADPWNFNKKRDINGYQVKIPYNESYSTNTDNDTTSKSTNDKPKREYVHSLHCNQNLPAYYTNNSSYDEKRFGINANTNSSCIIADRFGGRVLDNDIGDLNSSIGFKCIDENKRFKGYDSVSDLVLHTGEYFNNCGQHYSVGTSFYWDVILEIPDRNKAILPKLPFTGWFPIQSYQLQGLDINTNRVSTSMGDFEFLDSLNLPSSISLTIYETHRMDMDRWLNNYIDAVYYFDGSNLRIRPYKEQSIYIKFYWYDSNWIPIKSEKYIVIPKPQYSYEGSSEKDPKLMTLNFSIVGRLYDDDDNSLLVDNIYKPHTDAYKVAVKKSENPENVKVLGPEEE